MTISTRLYLALAVSGGILAGFALLPSFVAQPASHAHANGSMAASSSACGAVITRTLAPAEVRQCDTSTVSLELRPACVGEPLNVVLVLRAFAVPQARPAHRSYTQAAIDALDMPRNPHVRVGIVYLGFDQSILLDLTTDEKLVRQKSRINYQTLPVDAEERGLCYECGLGLATRVLSGAPRGQRSIIVFIGGVIHPEGSPLLDDWVRGARRARATADTFVVGCPWVLSCKLYSNWWREASPGYYFEFEAPGQFAMALEGLVAESATRPLAALRVADGVPDGLTYVADSASPPPLLADVASGRLRWHFSAPISDVITLTYRVQPQRVMTTAFDAGTVVLTDTSGAASLLPMPSAVLTVTELCDRPATPTPTSTATPAPTATPPPTATATRARPTATLAPQPVYLPLALNEAPCYEQQRVDVVLVLDASTSMGMATAEGRPKIDVAVEAARRFVDELRLGEGDRAAVVAFNADAQLLAGLTADRRVLDAALGGIELASQTCLVCGVQVAAEELLAQREAGRALVLVLLTDGQSNPRPASEAVDAAAAAKAAGVTVFTIGLGAELDEDALRAIASRPEYNYRAPDAADLEAIYRRIAVTIPCPGQTFWPNTTGQGAAGAEPAERNQR